MMLLNKNDKVHTCNCGMTFIWNESDITINGLYHTVICPACKEPMYVIIERELNLKSEDIKGEA